MLCHIAFDEVCVHQELALFLGTILTSNNYCCHVLLPLTCNALHGMCLLIKIVVELLVSHHLMCPMLLEKVLTCFFQPSLCEPPASSIIFLYAGLQLL